MGLSITCFRIFWHHVAYVFQHFWHVKGPSFYFLLFFQPPLLFGIIITIQDVQRPRYTCIAKLFHEIASKIDDLLLIQVLLFVVWWHPCIKIGQNTPVYYSTYFCFNIFWNRKNYQEELNIIWHLRANKP